MLKKIRVWDLPTRVFHWLFAIVIIGALITINLDETELHAKFGYAAFVLVTFRIIWGFVGPQHARFSSFVPSIGKLKTFIKHPVSDQLGHNPLGAISVIAILLIILLQTTTGLFTDDEIIFQGPLSYLVPSTVVSFLTGIHAFNSNLIYALVGLHLAAIFYYQKVKKESLIKPMLTGDKEVSKEQTNTPTDLIPSKDHWGVRGLALLILIVIGVGFYYLVIKK
jgi:cytochrome b